MGPSGFREGRETDGGEGDALTEVDGVTEGFGDGTDAVGIDCCKTFGADTMGNGSSSSAGAGEELGTGLDADGGLAVCGGLAVESGAVKMTTGSCAGLSPGSSLGTP